jgi:hypothetical protein
LTGAIFAAEDGMRALVPIAEALFSDLLAFGLLAAGTRTSDAELERYIVERYGPATLVIRVLEEMCGLRFADGAVPYCYNTVSWPDGTPLGGYAGHPGGPSPSAVLPSLAGNWTMVIKSEEHSAFPRLLRVSLWESWTNGLPSALRLLVDLARNGFVLSPRDLTAVIVLLLRARSQVDSDAEMVRRFLGTGVIDGPASFQGDMATDWVDSERPISEQSAELTNWLLEAMLEETESARAADSLDDWLVGRCRLGLVLGSLSHALHDLHPDPPVAVAAMLSQFEEIVADSGGSRLVWQRVPTFEQIVMLQVSVVAIGYQSAGGDDWPERMAEERVVLPDRFRDAWLAGLRTGDEPQVPFDALPRTWTHVSPRTAPAYAAVFSSDLPFGLWPAPTPGDEEPAGPTRAAFEQFREELLRCVEMNEAGQLDAAADGLRALADVHPWFSALHWEMAIAHDRRGETEAALDEAITAVLLGPTTPGCWHSLGVVLTHLGAGEEARLASGLGDYLESVQTNEAEQTGSAG